MKLIVDIQPTTQALIELTDFFSDCPNAFLQQTPYWAQMLESCSADKCHFFVCKDSRGKILGSLPVYLYDAAPGRIAVSVPSIGPLGGVSVSSSTPEEQVQEVYNQLLTSALNWTSEKNCLSFSTTTHPLLRDENHYLKSFQPDFLLKNFLQWIDVRNFFDPEMKVNLREYNVRSNLSRNVKKAAVANLQFVDLDFSRQEQELYDLHVRHHESLGVTPIEINLLRAINTYLVPKKKAFFWGILHEQKLISWVVNIGHGKCLDALRISIDPQAPDVGANYFLVDQCLRATKKHGFEMFNWQSSPSRESGVYRFKKQWGSIEQEYYFLTKLFCRVQDIEEIGLDGLRKHFPFRFIVPYNAFQNGKLIPGEYSKP